MSSCGCILFGDGPFAQAAKKADDPLMTLKGNPLREDASDQLHRCLVRKNMRRLEDDAEAWTDQRHGEAYRAIRGMTYEQR